MPEWGQETQTWEIEGGRRKKDGRNEGDFKNDTASSFSETKIRASHKVPVAVLSCFPIPVCTQTTGPFAVSVGPRAQAEVKRDRHIKLAAVTWHALPSLSFTSPDGTASEASNPGDGSYKKMGSRRCAQTWGLRKVSCGRGKPSESRGQFIYRQPQRLAADKYALCGRRHLMTGGMLCTTDTLCKNIESYENIRSLIVLYMFMHVRAINSWKYRERNRERTSEWINFID